VNDQQFFELVLLDADGTLLGSDGRVRAATASLLAELVASGVRVGLATGRSPKSIRTFSEQLPRLNGPFVLFNGGMVWDVPRGAAVWERHLPFEDALAVLRLAHELGVHVNLYVGEELLIREHTAVSAASEAKDGVPHKAVGDLASYLEKRGIAPYKLLMIDPAGEFDELVRRARAVLREPCTLVNSEPTYMELLPAGVFKGAALAPIAQHYGIPAARIMAFGDGKNDIELLGEVGLGVAMGNAHAELKAKADLVIGHHDTDAIAELVRGSFTVESGKLVRNRV
jgi:Cof subfamily protein (haloacid dehalogenase superfamily)